MKITTVPSESHEEIHRIEDAGAGLVGFIAIHSTRLGPAAGGLRMRAYASEDAALTDVMRLSEGMTYKNAAAGLPLGGGKAVILGDPAHDKSPALLSAFGRAIDSLKGRYWTAEDMGMTPADMAVMATQTPFVAGLADGAHASGDPSPVTARGIFTAIKVACRHRLGSDTLSGRTVSVQGLGNVGWHLCTLLTQAGAALIVTDMDRARVDRVVAEFGARPVAPEEIYAAKADIFAPCAIGAILNTETVPKLRVAIVAGGANNQLATDADAAALFGRGILYAPDFVANGGGIINAATEILKIDDRAAYVTEKLDALAATMDAILTKAARDGVSPAKVAIQTVCARMAEPAA